MLIQESQRCSNYANNYVFRMKINIREFGRHIFLAPLLIRVHHEVVICCIYPNKYTFHILYLISKYPFKYNWLPHARVSNLVSKLDEITKLLSSKLTR